MSDLATLYDGDAGWTGMEDRRTPALLPSGLAADLKNATVEFGDLRPRWGVIEPVWDSTTPDLCAGLSLSGAEEAEWYLTVTGFVVGETYTYEDNDCASAIKITNSATLGAETWEAQVQNMGDVEFSAPATTLYVHGFGPRSNGENPIIRLRHVPVALARWNDPAGEEMLVGLYANTRQDGSDPLTVGANDGGFGRAYRFRAGQTALEIPLNGHDVWGTSRLIPCRNGLALLRHGNARWYFLHTDVVEATDAITLNITPDLITGDVVTFVRATSAAGALSPLLDKTNYWAIVSGATVQLAASLANALAGTEIALTQPVVAGQYYLEKVSSTADYAGPGAIVLFMEETATVVAHVNGFKAPPANVTASISSGGSVWSATNHRFVAGQAVKITANSNTWLAATTYYCRPLSEHTFELYKTANNAMAPPTVDAENPYLAVGFAETNVQWRTAEYSGLPIVPGREGVYFKNRLIMSNQRDNIAISDPLDPLHFTPYEAALTANLGESTEITAIVPLGDDAVVLAKENAILGVTGIGRPAAGYSLAELLSLQEVSREFGCLAPLTACPVDSDQDMPQVWLLARKGVAAILRNGYGKLSALRVPVSLQLARKLLEVDWSNASKACAATFDNRYLVAVPLRGQDASEVANNCVLVWNTLTQGWDGYWESDDLQPVQFARHTVSGIERLCFLHADGHLRYFDPDALTDDTATAIAHVFISRAYNCGKVARKAWLELELSFDAWYCTYAVDAILEGVNEVKTIWAETVTDRTASFLFNTTPDIVNAPEAAYRQDYAILAGDAVLPSAGTIPVRWQSVMRRIPIRFQDRSVQFRITVTRGAMRLKSLAVTATPARGTPQPHP
jgi:hypothetical protein